jgi:hypothetical protein
MSWRLFLHSYIVDNGAQKANNWDTHAHSWNVEKNGITPITERHIVDNLFFWTSKRCYNLVQIFE